MKSFGLRPKGTAASESRCCWPRRTVHGCFIICYQWVVPNLGCSRCSWNAIPSSMAIWKSPGWEPLLPIVWWCVTHHTENKTNSHVDVLSLLQFYRTSEVFAPPNSIPTDCQFWINPTFSTTGNLSANELRVVVHNKYHNVDSFVLNVARRCCMQHKPQSTAKREIQMVFGEYFCTLIMTSLITISTHMHLIFKQYWCVKETPVFTSMQITCNP